jgi:hypothetical protein
MGGRAGGRVGPTNNDGEGEEVIRHKEGDRVGVRRADIDGGE